MTAIWQNEGSRWQLLSPAGFPSEAALHEIIAQSPELLPLSGRPQLVVLGREVQLGTGYADIVAVEDSGRLSVIEIKLARNSEARRAVVAQVLSYAAYLQDLTFADLELRVARGLGGSALREYAGASFGFAPQELDEFERLVSASLMDGWFRVVLVLDDAPDDLVRLVGYLEHVTNEHLIVDLITVSSYDVNGARVVIPQRLDTTLRRATAGEVSGAAKSATARVPRAPIVSGTAAFEEFLPEITEQHRAAVQRLLSWAKAVEARGHARLRTSVGSGRRVLRIEVPGEQAGLAAIWGERGRPGMSVHMTVLARRAPQLLATLRELLPPGENPSLAAEDVTDAVLEVTSSAYAEASSGELTIPSYP